MHLSHKMLRCTAAAMVVVYGVWQLYWLSGCCLPPSLFLAMTGMPAPTTGGTRSFLCLMRGDFFGSLHHNPMSIPIACMTVYSLMIVGVQAVRHEHVRLSNRIGVTWVAVLSLAWILKLLQAWMS